MEIVIDCKVKLSKKLRGILNESADKLSLVVSDLKDGIGKGKLFLSFDGSLESLEMTAEDLGETSIIIDPIDISEEYPREGGGVVGNIFSADMEHKKATVRDAVDKLAATEVPVKGQEAEAIVVKEEVETPEPFKELEVPECQEWVSNMTELINAVNKAKSKKQDDIDLSQAVNDREKDIMQAMKDKSEAIDTPAWIVNDKAAKITINDLGVDLDLNTPYNLTNISARKVAVSSDLRGLINSGFVRFISPKEAGELIGLENEEGFTGELEVFDNAAQAEANMTRTGSDIIDTTEDDAEDDAEEITSAELDGPMEEEGMILNLTQGMSKNEIEMAEREVSVARKTSHGNKPSITGPQSTTINTAKLKSSNSNIKTIKKISH